MQTIAGGHDRNATSGLRNGTSGPWDGFDLGRLLDVARRRVRTVALGAVACAILAGSYVLLSEPVYRATAELLISPQSLQIVGRDIVRTDVPTSLELASVDSQASVLLSTPVLRQVYTELDLSAFPEYQPRVGLLASLLGGPPISEDQREVAALDLLKRNIVVHRVESALVLRVIVSSPDAHRSAQIANALVAAYLKDTVQARVEAVQRANTSLVAQVSGLREQLDKAEGAVERFRSERGLIRSSETGLVVTQQLSNTYIQIDAAMAEVSRLAARKEQVAKISAEALLADTVPDVLTSPTLVALRTQYAQITREVASQSRSLLPQHPRMLELRAEITEAKRQIQSELNRLRSSAAESHSQAVNNLAKLRAQAKELTLLKVTSSESETKLRQLESEAEAVRSVLNTSLNRARELDQQRLIEPSNSRLLSKATPPIRPSNPPLTIVLAAASLFGACLGLGVAVLQDMTHERGPEPRTREPMHGGFAEGAA